MKTREGTSRHNSSHTLQFCQFDSRPIWLGIKQQKYFSLYIHNFYKLLCKCWRWKVLYR